MCFSFSTLLSFLKSFLFISLPPSPWTSLPSPSQTRVTVLFPCHGHFGLYDIQPYYWPGPEASRPIRWGKDRPNDLDTNCKKGGWRDMKEEMFRLQTIGMFVCEVYVSVWLWGVVRQVKCCRERINNRKLKLQRSTCLRVLLACPCTIILLLLRSSGLSCSFISLAEQIIRLF